VEIDYKAIGRRIKFARIRKDVTQEVIAEKVQMSLQHVSNIETGNTKLSLPAVIAMANAVGASVDEFLRDNVLHSKHVFIKEAKDLFEDCDDYEVRVLVDVLKATKDALRKDAALRNKLEK